MLARHEHRNPQQTSFEWGAAAPGLARSGGVSPEPSGRTEPPNGESDGAASRLAANLLRAAHLLRTALNEHLAEFGLNDVRYAVLVEVDRCGPSGCTQTELAERLRQSESNICTLVERMRQDGWLYRHRAKSDRRKRILRPTERARETLGRIRACHEERLRRLLSGLSAEEQQRLGELLRSLCGCLDVRLGAAGTAGVAESGVASRSVRTDASPPRLNSPAAGPDGQEVVTEAEPSSAPLVSIDSKE